jgi:hypothetical protein
LPGAALEKIMTMTEINGARLARSNTEWGPIFAGAVLATAVGLVLLTFGAALGLSVTSAYDNGGLSPAAYAIAAGLYLLWVQLTSFYIGGYVAARLRARSPDANEHEVDVRDGLHGFLVWSLGVIAAAIISFAGIGGATTAAYNSHGSVAASVAHVMDRQVDQSVNQEQVQGPPAAENASDAERRAEIARKLSIISAFIAAASLLAGAVAAFFGAHAGGHHRDKNIVMKMFVAERPPVATP